MSGKMKNLSSRLVSRIFFLILSCSSIYAQKTIGGKITDEHNMPVEMATVKLLKGVENKLINYSFTNTGGNFNLNLNKQTDSLKLSVSLLGYKTITIPVISGQIVNLQLETEVFNLREVEIRPGRVWGRQDTINYDVAQFLSPKDESIKDILKKLPGVDVDDVGRISYNGKDISKFYVEGMDLTGGRYNQINNNLQAKAVETVQVLENHQPIRILQEKVKVEDIAINLRLKPEFRDKWMISIRGGTGFNSDDLLWEGGIDALQLSRKSQSAYVYKTNNQGKDVADEQMILIENSSYLLKEIDIPAFVSQLSLTAPLKKDRFLFNNVHSLSANRLYKLSENTQLRINGEYTHDRRKQERGSETIYYLDKDSEKISEESSSGIRSEKINLNINLENNSPDYYLTNRFSSSGDWTKSNSFFTGKQSIQQSIRNTDSGFKNEFRNLWNKTNSTFEVRSLMRYNHLPTALVVNGERQKLHLDHFYTDNSFSFFRKKGDLSQRYIVGITGQLSNIQNGLSTYTTPSWQLAKGKWLNSLATSVVWTNFPGKEFSRIAINPSFSIQYKLNYAWRFSASARFQEQYGNVTEFYVLPFLQDYRNTLKNNGKLSIQKRQTYFVYSEYKNTIKEFFSSLSLGHTRILNNQIWEQIFENDLVTLKSYERDNWAYNWSLRGTVSKGFYDWKMKASLNCILGLQEGKYLNKTTIVSHKSSYMQYEPKLSWNPHKRFETSYQAVIRYGGSKIGESTRLTPLWNIVEKIFLSYEVIPLTEINLSVDHYYNDMNSSKSIQAFFADLSLRWKTGAWQFIFQANNIFDKKQYSYTEYSSQESYTSWINIRAREFMASARYKF